MRNSKNVADNPDTRTVQSRVLYLLDRGYSTLVNKANKLVSSPRFDLKDFADILILERVGLEKLNQKQLGAAVGIHPNVMVRRVNALQERGLMMRTKDGKNNREYLLVLTTDGAKFVNRWHDDLKHAKLTDPLTEAELRNLEKLLSKVIQEDNPAKV